MQNLRGKKIAPIAKERASSLCCKRPTTESGRCPWHNPRVVAHPITYKKIRTTNRMTEWNPWCQLYSENSEKETTFGVNDAKTHKMFAKTLPTSTDAEDKDPLKHAAAATPKSVSQAKPIVESRSERRRSEKPMTRWGHPITPVTVTEGLARESTQTPNVAAWFIYRERPPNVPRFVYERYSIATRKDHIRWLFRIKTMRKNGGATFDVELVQLILTEADKGRWLATTLAKAFGAVRTALGNLPNYTNMTRGITVGTSFMAALSRAQKLARGHVPVAPKPISEDEYNKVRESLRGTRAYILLTSMWNLAARASDMRALEKRDIQMESSPAANGEEAVLVTVTYRGGKGAYFRGAYSCMSSFSKAEAKMLQAVMKMEGPIFNQADQQAVAQALKIRGFECRSIRKGRLCALGERGISDADLMALSGHTSVRTLHRYLKFGAASATSKNAAIAIRDYMEDPDEEDDESAIHGGGDVVRHPTMGPLSGFNGVKGRRMPAPPMLFPIRPPTACELGILDECTDDWPLHIKHVGTANWETLEQIADRKGTSSRLQLAKAWATTTEMFPEQAGTVADDNIPRIRLNAKQLAALVEAGKIEQFDGCVKNTVRGFLLPEVSKRRLRPIFEPSLNDCVDEVPGSMYLSRLERRQQVAGDKRCIALYDIAAAFDQILIPHSIRNHFVFRCGDDRYALTRLPMGARWSPWVMQTVLVTLLPAKEVLQRFDVEVSTMIDNVRFASKTREGLRHVTQIFLENVRMAGITLNEGGEVIADEDTESYIFLGEEFSLRERVVRNAPKLCEKLHKAYVKWEAEGGTARMFVSIIGLVIYMAHTLSIPLNQYYHMMKVAGRCSSRGNWDAKWSIKSPKAAEELHHLVKKLLENPWVKIVPRSPPKGFTDHTIQIISDASRTGWGAFIVDKRTCTTYMVNAPWAKGFRRAESSAAAEPEAVRLCVRWVRHTLGFGGAVAVATDHAALVACQQNERTGFGGHSMAYHLNRCLAEMGMVKIYFVPGEQNIADRPSRTTVNKFTVVEVRDVCLPHPLSRADDDDDDPGPERE